ncbi:hypothetical protein V1477_005377 [Vespula maculifrons]|uniref:Uncharacterized protein n=1 Tax=Vespula maculifrons TaxID=7453 RepID=A0ABD2CPK0_VESMC
MIETRNKLGFRDTNKRGRIYSSDFDSDWRELSWKEAARYPGGLPGCLAWTGSNWIVAVRS